MLGQLWHEQICLITNAVVGHLKSSGSASADCSLWKAARRWKEIERDGSRVVERRSKTKKWGGEMVAGWKAP